MRGSTEKVELAASILNDIAGLIDLLRSAFEVMGTPRPLDGVVPTGPTPRPMLSGRGPVDEKDGRCERLELEEDAAGRLEEGCLGCELRSIDPSVLARTWPSAGEAGNGVFSAGRRVEEGEAALAVY